MSEIKTFSFNKESFENIKKYEYGKNWPVVYIIENGKDAYVGETIRAYHRTKEHLENPQRNNLKKIHIITDEEYNVSATLDIESWLIQYISADDSFVLQNGNDGLKNHNYFDKEKYKAKFENIWKKLQEMNLVKKDLVHIRNSDLFKYSPYKALTDEQISVVVDLFNNIQSEQQKTYIINGKPGTGKTILAVYLIKYLKEQKETKHLQIGLVVPMTQLRGTIKRVFSNVKGLKSNMVIGPNDVNKKKYDILIIDEAHRLKQRKNITNYKTFDDTNKKFGLDNSGTELDWIMKSSKHQVFFYDKNQSIRPSDLGPEKFSELNAIHYDLASQQRIIAGDEYIKFVDDLFDMQKVAKYKFPNYDLKVYDDIHNMVSDIKKKDAKLGLCRMVAGYAWEWKSRNNPNAHDIEIDGLKLKWNSTNKDWVNSPNAVNEIGCIHTVQGYDLNYVGVIIGPELSYDKEKNVLVINDDNYMDANGWRGISDPKELERYIINIYKTILTRGILGTYIYIVDEVLREYLKTRINEMGNTKITPVKKEKETLSPYVGATISIPILGSVACGSPFYVEENFEGTIEVPENKLLKGTKYFILRASGDSMNKAGINDGDLVLCQHKLTAHPNDLVVALTNDGVTIKEFHRDASDIILKPRSTNPDHEPIRFTEDGSVEIQGIVREVIKL